MCGGTHAWVVSSAGLVGALEPTSVYEGVGVTYIPYTVFL